MNMDNERLREIKIEKSAYHKLMNTAETVRDCINIQNNIERLEKEELEILERWDVIL